MTSRMCLHSRHNALLLRVWRLFLISLPHNIIPDHYSSPRTCDAAGLLHTPQLAVELVKTWSEGKVM